MQRKRNSAITVVTSIVAMSLILAIFAGGARPAAAQSAGSAQIRVVHTSFDAPAVDIYADGNKLLSNLSFKGVSDWASVAGGQRDLKVTTSGKTDAIVESKINIESGKYYTILIGGKLANITTKLLEDNLSPLPSGTARLRLIHASPDTPAVDVDLNNGLVLVPNLGFLEASSYLEAAAKPADVKIRPAGATNVALALSGVQLEAGTVYSFLVVGQSQGMPPLSVVTVAATAGKAGPISEALPASGSSPANTAPQSTMPVTGAGDDALTMAALSLALVALCSVAGGVAIRARTR